MTNDDEFEHLLRDAAPLYNKPPEPPREAMWAAIERARAEQSVVPIAAPRRVPRWLTAAAGIAAVLLVGIAIGRMSQSAQPQVASTSPDTSRPDAPRVAAVVAKVPAEAPTTDSTPASAHRVAIANSMRRSAAESANRATEQAGDQTTYRMAVVEHLARTEVLLASFRSQVRSGNEAKVDAQFAFLSRDLLATTRLLLATRHGDDPAITRLLQDLELVLMQLNQYANDGRRSDVDAIEHSLEKHNVMPKLRSTIPAGFASTSGT